ncbi:PREDICTED: uncharacterized protein LOC104588894 [Nelumbo nucifera]|uniref:IST1-like protein n=2 Tax=Nelumbo nucifera TaxID=4432 RepID=A0A822XMX5_NELNU|nr:PREDICTED: uncharacterized protein LOC104588894 [Nelumbo nucifera]DAD22964.1 TPA_asm: hypothetical protein HUJ06_024427 [Nelumbo nucifera]
MFDILFGWRKASKCKKLIRCVQYRLKLLKNKRSSIIRQLREDIAQLLKNGRDQSAFIRAEQLYKDQRILAIYDLLDHFCEFIIIHLPYIRRHRDCPNDINEAVSSLIFAAARCGDLPELQMIRKLFAERYGHKYSTAADELLPGNLVNHQVREKLCMKSIPDDVKHKLIDEIAIDYSLQLRPVGILDRFELQEQQGYDCSMGNSGNQCEGQIFYKNIHISKEVQMQASINEKIQVNARSNGTAVVTEPSLDKVDPHCCTHFLKNVSKLDSNEHLNPLDKPEINVGSYSSAQLSMPSQQHKVDRVTIETTSENLCRSHDGSIVYIGGVEEFKSTTQGRKYKDQRLLRFKSIKAPRCDNCGAVTSSLSALHGDGFVGEHTQISESWNGQTISRNSSKRRKSTRKKLKRRSFYQSQIYDLSVPVTLRMKDTECELYYGGECGLPPNGDPRHRTAHRRKHQKKISTEKNQSSSFKIEEKKFSPHQPINARKIPNELFFEKGGKYFPHKYNYDQRKSYNSCSVNDDMVIDCSLEHTCYFLACDNKDDWASPCWKQGRGIIRLEGFPCEESIDSCHHFCFQNRAFQNDITVSETQCLDNQSKKKEWREEDDELSDCHGSLTTSQGSSSTCSWTKTVARPQYMRNMTMPPERPKPLTTGNILRSSSCHLQQANRSRSSSSSNSSSHVHPKLPDYDDLATKFMALKKEHMQTKHAKLAMV